MNKKKVKLFIDTSDKNIALVELFIDRKRRRITKESKSHKDQVVLELIEEILNKYNLCLHDLTDVDVNRGPGSYTGIRVGVSVANAIIYSLRLSSKFVEPLYSL